MNTLAIKVTIFFLSFAFIQNAYSEELVYLGKQVYAKDVAEKKDLEFDVWIKTTKDSEGNDIQLFFKEDKARGLRRDSSFYQNGTWEVYEFDDLAKETRFRASWGVRSLRRYDDAGHLNERYMIDGNGDTLISVKYEWKKGRLVRMIADGIVRNYIYGKTLKDTVRVEPSDEGFNYHSGYNGTVGKIPEEGEPRYEIFIRDPYGHVSFESGYEESREDNECPSN